MSVTSEFALSIKRFLLFEYESRGDCRHIMSGEVSKFDRIRQVEELDTSPDQSAASIETRREDPGVTAGF